MNQCPCDLPINKKQLVKYDFGLVGNRTFFVCLKCRLDKNSPYSKFIIKVQEENN